MISGHLVAVWGAVSAGAADGLLAVLASRLVLDGERPQLLVLRDLVPSRLDLSC